jgi:hypothetical protein
MRLKRRYQEGGRVNDLLRMLEQQEVQKEAQRRMPPPMPMATEPSAASSTGVSMQRPVYTSPEDAMIDQSRSAYTGFAKMFGEPMTEEDAQYLRETQDLPSGAIQSYAPIAEFLSPVGDVKAMAEAGSGAELAMAAGLAFVPGNLSMIKDALPQFIRPSQIVNLEKILDAVDDVSGSAEELISINAPQIANMSDQSRKELADALQEMSSEISGFPMFSREEINRLDETARYLKSSDAGSKSKYSAKSSVGPKQKIGKFELEYGRDAGRDGMVYRSPDNDDYISLVEESPNNFTLVALLEETKSPSQRGLLLAETIKQVPKGGRVQFGSVNDLSSDSYVFPLSYIEKGKAKPDLSNVEFIKLNELGQHPNAFAQAFGIEPRQVAIVDGRANGTAAEVAEIKSKIDAKLKSLGLPETKTKTVKSYDFSTKQLEDVPQILMPHFDMIKTIERGEFKYGGNLRVLKMNSGGKFRPKKSY